LRADSYNTRSSSPATLQHPGLLVSLHDTVIRHTQGSLRLVVILAPARLAATSQALLFLVFRGPTRAADPVGFVWRRVLWLSVLQISNSSKRQLCSAQTICWTQKTSRNPSDISCVHNPRYSSQNTSPIARAKLPGLLKF
jgi:hypothetical protein